MVISQAVMQKWYKRSQIIFEKILKNIGTLHAGELAETNCSFYEIPAIVKNPISGFAKCEHSPLSANHANAILARNDNFSESS